MQKGIKNIFTMYKPAACLRRKEKQHKAESSPAAESLRVHTWSHICVRWDCFYSAAAGHVPALQL